MLINFHTIGRSLGDNGMSMQEYICQDTPSTKNSFHALNTRNWRKLSKGLHFNLPLHNIFCQPLQQRIVDIGSLPFSSLQRWKISWSGWREVTGGTKNHWKILNTCGAITFINKICSIVISSYFNQPRVVVIMHYY